MSFSTKDESTMDRIAKFPHEFGELRFWSFVLIIVLAVYLMGVFALPKPVFGMTDPFYSPTILVLPFVAGFRATCYAYRKDYHRHLFKHPVACGVNNFASAQRKTDLVGEKKGRLYSGETNIFRLENLHRYFWYSAVAILPFFYYDIYVSLAYNGTFTLGAIILIVNTAMVTIYTFSCHFFRHVTGGNVDCYSCPVSKKSFRRGFFNGLTKLNEHHELFAWLSLAMFFLTDLYIRGMAGHLFVNPVLFGL